MNIEELKRLAEAATPGPWVSHPKGYYGAVCRADDQYDLVAVTHGQRRNNVLANEAYIAAANPAAVLELIRQRDELLAALRHLYHNAKKSGAEMGLGLDVARSAIARAEG